MFCFVDRVQARNHDFAVGGGGGGGGPCEQWRCKFLGGPGECYPEKIPESLDYLRLHFARFHGEESEKENIE